jgi:hypothetical protein
MEIETKELKLLGVGLKENGKAAFKNAQDT